MTGIIWTIFCGLGGVLFVLFGVLVIIANLGNSYVVLRECRHCGREMAIGNRSELRRQGWRVSLGVCRHCSDRVDQMTDAEIEALIEGAGGPS